MVSSIHQKNIRCAANPAIGPVRVADIVSEGEDIAILKAMRMENAIHAPRDGQNVEIGMKLNNTV